MKTDFELGKEVQEYLISKGVETPIKEFSSDLQITNEAKKNLIENSFREIMKVLGLDLQNDSLIETPKRVAKMYVEEIFSGLDYQNFPKCTTVANDMKYDEMVTVDDITSLSNCEHHFVVIDGLVRVSYIPKDRVLGLSKINRIVDFFSKRPQIQERLTEQIFHALCFILGTEDVAVRIDAVHYCVKSRGVRDTSSRTKSTKLGGTFKNDPNARAEFLK